MDEQYQENISISKNLITLWKFISRRRKKELFFLLLLTKFSGILEIFTLTSIIPFLNVLINPENLLQNRLIINLGLSTEKQLFIIFPLLFGSLALIASLTRILNLWFNGRVSAKIGTEFSIRSFKNILCQDYEYHLNQKSNEVINSLSIEMSRIPDLINSILRLITASILLISLLIGLLLINWQATLSSGIILGLIYLYILYFCKERLNQNGKRIANRNDLQLKYIQEGLGSIKEIILNQTYNIYINNYRKNDLPLKLAQVENKFLAIVPRFLIEGILLFIVSIYVLYLINFTSQGISNNFPIIGALVLGGSKIFPLFQMIYASLAAIQVQRTSLNRIVKYLQLQDSTFDLNKRFNSKFNNDITFKNVNFKYKNNSKNVLKNISFTIRKGEKIGIFGTTGSGKSTLLDLFMGLNKPSKGNIFVDGYDINDKKNISKLKSWHQSISHVPQKMYFTNATIAENIAFGVPKKEINMERIHTVSELAKISEFIESSPLGYDSLIGERGVNLSGGQLQRIAIARALYRSPKVLILDEITSALDTQTEKEVLSSIRTLDKSITIIVIAHRKSTLKNCDKIIQIENGQIQKTFLNSEFKEYEINN